MTRACPAERQQGVVMVTCDISLNITSCFLFQEKMLDMESDLEELHDSEQRWAAKQKRAIEQVLHRLPAQR